MIGVEMQTMCMSRCTQFVPGAVFQVLPQGPHTFIMPDFGMSPIYEGICMKPAQSVMTSIGAI
jgi:hypothetical protein